MANRIKDMMSLINPYRFGGPPSLESQALAIFAGGLGAGGLQGLMLDLSKASSLYTDAARTTLVSAAGDGIGSPSDLSPNGNHPTQATATARPLWASPYANFDGVDDSWTTAAIDFTGTDSVTIVTALRKAADDATRILYSLGNVNTEVGTFEIWAPQASGFNNIASFAKGTTSRFVSNTGLVSPVTFIHTMQMDISAPLVRARVNGGAWVSSALSQGTGNLGNRLLQISGRGGGLMFSGGTCRQYVIGKILSDAELAIVEAWANEPVLVLP